MQGGEKAVARALQPFPLYGRGRFDRNDVVAFETEEMVQAHDIHQFQDGLHPGDPPGILCVSQHIPAIYWIAPALPDGTKIVWGYASHPSRLAGVIKGKQFRVPPDIGAVGGHIDRHIANQTNTMAMAVLLQRLPLTKELKLQKLVCGNGAWIRISFVCPLRPGEASIGLFERHKRGKRVEPGLLLGTKRFKGETIYPR